MNYCFTLSYNLPSETEKVTKLLYAMNDCGCFKHLIIDLGFPLVEDEIPDDYEKSRKAQSAMLRKIASTYGSDYVRMENIGVSQNWTNAFKYINPKDTDTIIGCDPDEHPLDAGWVRAMGETLKEFAMATLLMPDHISLLTRVPKTEKWVGGTRVYVVPNNSMNWALIGFSGRFMNEIGHIPVPMNASRYGWIEGAVTPYLTTENYWCVLPDYLVRHTDYELGDPGTSRLLREWKNQIVIHIHQYGQISFEEFLTMRKEGKI